MSIKVSLPQMLKMEDIFKDLTKKVVTHRFNIDDALEV